MRELFARTENNNPDTSKKVAFGKSGAITENMTLANFATWIIGQITSTFLKKSNNLREVTPSTARTNLGVYSKTEVDALVASIGEYSGTRQGVYIKASNFYCIFLQFGKVVVCTGALEFDSLPPAGTAIINIPALIGKPKHTVWFAGGISTGIGRPVFNAYIDATESQIRFSTGDNGYYYYFNFTYVTA